MRNRSLLLLAILVAALFLSLRHDLALWAARQAEGRLAAGDYPGALRMCAAAGRLGGDSAWVSFDAAVARYRLGEYREAGELFARAAAEPRLRGSALYNLGNCAYRRAERPGPGDPLPAVGLLREAAGYYERSLALAPQAADASHNLTLARARLAALARPGSRPPAGTPPREAAGKPEGTQAGKGAGKGAGERSPGRQAQREGAAGATGSAARGEAGRAGGTRGSDDRVPGAAGGQLPKLSRAQAEGLLDEARGRELRSPVLRGGRETVRQARPEKEW